MEIQQLSTLLSGNSYPGRGIVLGRSKDGKTAMIAYFIMGRSVNSRNRVFEENDRGGIRTKAFDESKMAVSYTHLRAHETPEHLVCRLLL